MFDNRVTEAFAFDNVISRNDVTAPTPALRTRSPAGVSSSLAEKTNFSGNSSFLRKAPAFVASFGAQCALIRLMVHVDSRAAVEDGATERYLGGESKFSLWAKIFGNAPCVTWTINCNRIDKVRVFG